jgi:hypothetical protein
MNALLVPYNRIVTALSTTLVEAVMLLILRGAGKLSLDALLTQSK